MKKILYIIIPILSFFIFKNNVNAESNLLVAVANNGSYSTSSSYMDKFLYTLKLDSSFTGDTEDVFLHIYINSRYQNFWNNYIIFRNKNNNSYLISSYGNNNIITDLNLTINENGQYVAPTTASLFYNNLLLNKNGGLNENSTSTTFSKIIFTTNEGNIFYGLNDFNSGFYSSLNINQDYEIIDTNIENLTIDNTPWKDYYSPYPSNYQEINMLNKYAVLFYPKDFRNLEQICTSSYIDQSVETDEDGNITIIDNEICTEKSYNFNFYYKGDFQYGLTDLSLLYELNNSKKISSIDFTSLDITSSLVGFKGGIIFYNTTTLTTTDDDGNVTYLDKQQSNILYNSDLFNYIIIDNKEDFIDQNISYIDSNGENQDIFIYSQLPDKNNNSSLKLNSDLINKYKFSSNFKNFFSELYKTIEFFKYNLEHTFSSIPSIFIILIILMLLWLLAKKFILK